MATKKLIEVALPLEKINAESAREKSIRHGHPSTLHLWWARRPLAAARAVIWSSLVDDPSSHLEKFPTEEEQNRERQRLFRILEELVVWENSNDERVLAAAKEEILKSTNGNPPELLDPFAGGGTIPLEAQRLGLKAHAHDLNPVAVMINKAMIEIPPLFSGNAPVNPNARTSRMYQTWTGASGLAEDVQYYGEWMKQEAFKRIGHLYPKVKVPQEQGGGEATVIAWIWARTVKCPNPACGCRVPLLNSFYLSKKSGKEAYITPEINGENIKYRIHLGKPRFPKEIEFGTKSKNAAGKATKATFCCPFCNAGIIKGEYTDREAEEGRMGSTPVCIVAEGDRGRVYIEFTDSDAEHLGQEVNNYYVAHSIDDYIPKAKCRGTFASNAQGRYYGFHEFKDYFSKRQLIALVTLADLVKETQKLAESDAKAAGMSDDHIPLTKQGCGARGYGEAIGVYLSFLADQLANQHSTMCGWDSSITKIRSTYGRQGIAMSWDYAEGNIFSSSTASYKNMFERLCKAVASLNQSGVGHAKQFDAQSDCGLREIMVSTDPPYYDNICYSDLSDFFYVWLRESLKSTYPELCSTMLVPKAEELIATPYRHDGSVEKAKDFFEEGMLDACKRIYDYAREDIPVTIYYAYKQSDSDDSGTSSSGWETMLGAIVNAGFAITGTWPMRTEMANRSVASGANALASSIVLVCRKRPADAPQTTRRNLVNQLRRELRPALKKLQESNIAPVDLAQSAIGPGMGVFSRYKQVLEADGTSMSVRSALKIINEEIDLYFNEQVGDMDSASRFCVDLYTQSAFNNIKYGEAEILATAKSTSIPMMASHGVLYAKAGIVHLIDRSELTEKVDSNEQCIWMLTQQLTQAMTKGGVEACAKILADLFGSNGERAKDLAYRLYTIAERKNWTNEAYTYNALVVAWPDIQARAATLKESVPEQLDLFSIGILDE